MEPSTDFQSLQDSLQKSLVNTVKVSNRIASEDLSFQRTVNPDVAELLDERSQRLRDLSSRLLKSAASACGLKAPVIEDAEDVDMKWRGILDVVDTVLEKADTALDEYTGLIKRKEPPTENASEPKKQKSKPQVIRNANITKPQTTFDVQPENFPTGPWKPILTNKPHATVSLKKSLKEPKATEGAAAQYKHPYHAEITTNDYPEQVFEKAEPIKYKPIDNTRATFVDTWEGVLEMLETLKEAKEIAVDLEHHDFRTYTGLVCLMQISTREQDWIVDTLKPWRHKLEILNEVFADPSIVKVFHGSYMDMIWLQRDLGLYVNGLFDTYFACDLLGYAGKGLAFLLSKFADFTADKQYQLADWRIRPLPEEMMYYARSDTHYLLYIYDEVRNELIERSNRSEYETDLIKQAVDRSREVSLYRHEHPGFDPKTGEGSRGWYNYILKHPSSSFDAEQFAVFRALWQWRDQAARKEDENPNYVLSSSAVLSVARHNPPDAKALHSLLPLSPPIARRALNEIWEEIKKTKAEGGPTLLQFITSAAPESLFKGASRNQVSLPTIDGELAVRSLPQSQLFGSMPISSKWEPSRQDPANDNDTIPFPWQRFVDEASANVIEDVQEDEPMADEPAEEPTAMSSEEDEEFTLKRGTKRKATPDSPQEKTAQEIADEIDLDASGIIEVDDEPKRSKKSKKARRDEKKRLKAEKHEKQLSEQAASLDDEEDSDVEVVEKPAPKSSRKDKKDTKSFNAVPFDYSQAASVMHASRETQDAEKKKRGGKKEKVFDPYVKSVEQGVKGGRKAMPIKGERSATFKK